MRYAIARYQKDQRELAYRIFVTDCLQLAPQGKYRTDRFADCLKTRKADNRTGDEIAVDVIKRARLSFEKVI